MDISSRLQTLIEERGWSPYRLAKEAGLPASTVGSLFTRKADLTVHTLEQICQGLRISPAQFFEEESRIGLTEEERGLLFSWSCLRQKDRKLVRAMIDALAEK